MVEIGIFSMNHTTFLWK